MPDQQVLMCVTDCKYDVVRQAARTRGWKLVEEDADSTTARRCHVYWVDVPAIMERMQQLHPWQRINHFPGMSNVARKGRLAQNLDRMRRSFPHEFGFYPRTWVLPAEWGGFKAEFDANGKSTRTFIVKPDSGCQGRGIFLTQDLDRVASMESQVAQLYVRKPLLVEGFKFDLRVYVLVTSVIPLRVYAFKDGLARFCTEEYLRPSSENLDERCMHLTNYAVNKGSENFVPNDTADRDDLGSKRSLRWLLEWVASQHGEDRAESLWRKMGDACVKTLVSILPTLHREYLHTFGPDKDRNVGDIKEDGQGGEARAGYCAGVDSEGGEVAVGDAPPAEANDRHPHEEHSPRREVSGHQQHGSESGEQEKIYTKTTDTATSEEREGTAAQSVFHNTQKEGGNSRDAEGSAMGVVEGSRCLEILGFDFMIDAALKPWLIEVNHLPSFATDSPLDRRIKSQVVGTAMSVLRAKADDRKCYEDAAKRDARNRLYRPEAAVSLSREQERKEEEAMVAKIRGKVGLTVKRN